MRGTGFRSTSVGMIDRRPWRPQEIIKIVTGGRRNAEWRANTMSPVTRQYHWQGTAVRRSALPHRIGAGDGLRRCKSHPPRCPRQIDDHRTPCRGADASASPQFMGGFSPSFSQFLSSLLTLRSHLPGSPSSLIQPQKARSPTLRAPALAKARSPTPPAPASAHTTPPVPRSQSPAGRTAS
jgi:hypothetical protein